MMSLSVVLLCILALLATAIVAVLWPHSTTRLVYLTAALVSAIICVAGVIGLGLEHPETLVLPVGLPWLGSHFRLDALAAFFLVVVNLGGVGASLFGVGYGRHATAPARVLPFFPSFLAGMNLVVVADDAFSFLLSWELMSLMSWALVVSEDRVAENLRAGYVYIIMASFGTLALLLAFGILAGPNGSYAFESMRGHALTQSGSTLVLLLLLLGAGSKAGLFPLHAWLPLAHPAAPSHVSALMSGVMTKVATYAFIRIGFEILGPVDWRLCMVVIAAGGATALMGILYALMQRDVKRLLAYSTVENIGIIFVGLGLAMAFRADGLAGAAALAASAALLHVFNHSVFKSLLFFGSGAVLTATGERDIEALGGLITRMPWTSIAFLIGSAAISALPPLNGFASEWLLFQAIFLSPDFPQWGLRFLAPSTGAMLALAAGLAAACFVKAFGVAFLGRPRSRAAELARETDPLSVAVMIGLAAVCVVAGVVPGLFADALAPVVHMLTAAQMPAQNVATPWTPLLPSEGSANSYGALVVFAALLTALGTTFLGVRVFANSRTRRGPAWDCGYPDPRPVTQYTGGSFAQPITRVFATIAFRAREAVLMPAPGGTGAARYRLILRDPAWETLYVSVARAVDAAAGSLNRLQFLTIRRYLTIVFATLVVLLLVLALWL